MNGKPRNAPSYVYTIPSDTFEPVGAYQWVSKVSVPILDIEQFEPGELDAYWRPATPSEIQAFMKRIGITEL